MDFRGERDVLHPIVGPLTRHEGFEDPAQRVGTEQTRGNTHHFVDYYYRRRAGEHPDRDEYRQAMLADLRTLIRITIERAGPDRHGYGRETEWLMVQGRDAMCVLFEYAATLGMIDVAYVDPTKARRDFRALWGADDLDFFSRYDGLMSFRLTPLGAYCLGLTDAYTPQQIEARARLTPAQRRVTVSSGTLSLDEAMLLDTWADKESDDTWHLDQAKAINAIETGGQIAELHQFLHARDAQELPEPVEGFLVTPARRARACTNKGAALLIECTDAAIAAQLATSEPMKKLCLRAGDKHLVVMADAEAQFRRALRGLGYGMSRI